MKFRFAAAAAFAMLATPALAQNLTGIKCESPEVIKIMTDQLKGASGGTSLTTYGVYIDRITKSRTVQASKSKLVCALSVRVTAGGSTSTMRLRFTYEFFAGGKKTYSIAVM